MRAHYLILIAGVSVAMLIILSLPSSLVVSSIWLPLTALPYYALYWRDLRLLGYRGADIVRVHALNVMLIPINLGGATKSMEQAITGKKIPFSRTPKAQNRTTAPWLYLVAEAGLFSSFAFGGADDLVHDKWLSAGLALCNAAVFGYILVKYIGLKALWNDMTLPLRRLGS